MHRGLRMPVHVNDYYDWISDAYDKMKDEAQQDALQWYALIKWLRSPTGQEYLDEWVWGTEDSAELLTEYNLRITDANKKNLLKIIDELLTSGY
jgi:hypothetical protein